MLSKQSTIYLYKGATSTVKFDFTDFDFDTYSKCVFTMTPVCSEEVIFRFEFTESKPYICVFKDEETAKLNHNLYKYNIMYIVSGERYPMCLDSDVEVKEVINGHANYNN